MREVGILDRKLRQRREPALGDRSVCFSEFAAEEEHGSAVEDDLVDGQNEEVRRGRPPEENRSQQRTSLEIEGTADFHPRPMHDVPFTLGFGRHPEVLDSKRKVSSESDDGNRPAVDRGKARSEDLMAMDDGFQALLEGSDVEKARDSPSERYVVGGARRL
jgi:hypothetical protein